MKGPGFVIAAAALAVILSDAALGAVRYVRSPRHARGETGGTILRRGNVTRSTTAGNVRYSEPRRTRRTRPRSDVTPSTPSVIRRTSSPTTHHRSGLPARRTLSSSTRHTINSVTPPTSTVRTVRTKPSRPTRHVSTPSSTRRRRGKDTPHRTIGNVRYSEGNVVYSYRHKGRHARRRTHKRHHERERDRHHDHHSHHWPSGYTFIYCSGDCFIYVHAGRRGPYWYNGRWHPYRDGCRRVLYHGYWIDTRDRYYVLRLEPPWAKRAYDLTLYEMPYYEESKYEYAVDDEYDEDDFIRKSEIRDAVLVKELALSAAERRRVDTLIARGIIRDILEEANRRREFDYEFDKRKSRLTLTAPSERIAVIETMVRDRRTFEAVTKPDRYGNTAAVLPLVSPLYLEQDFQDAVRLATENLSVLRRMLQDRDRRYTYHGKACWLNAEYGTATVVDDKDNVERVAALMELRPFVPRDLVRR